MEGYALTIWVVAESDYQARRLGEIGENAMNDRLAYYGRLQSATLKQVRPLRRRWPFRRTLTTG